MLWRRSLAVACVYFTLALVSISNGGIRAPGKYSGTVIFDRWDGCILYSGIYVMPISEAVKEKVRKHAGKSIQIDAKEVHQPMNPGDGLIKELTYLGLAPAAQKWLPITGLSLVVAPALLGDERPRFTITIQNNGIKDVEVSSLEFAPTLLMKKTGREFPIEPSDGPSFALTTRQSFGGRDPQVKGREWNFGAALPGRFKLKPREKRVLTITFDLAEGEYDFLAGYGGGAREGEGIASNLIAFDVVTDGKAKLVKVKGR